LIAGNLSKKKIRPETEGTLKVENLSFLVLFVGVMIIIGGLILALRYLVWVTRMSYININGNMEFKYSLKLA